MLEDSVSSTWEYMANWFTPTVLFLLLHLTIATIVFISSITQQNPSSNAADDNNVPRSTKVSLLHRFKSTKHRNFDSDHFYDGIESHTHYLFQHTTPTPIQFDTQIQPHSNLETLTQALIETKGDGDSADFDLVSAADEDSGSLSEIYNQVTGNQVDGVESDEDPQPEVINSKMWKSASLGFDLGHSQAEESNNEDGVEARRPATVSEKESSKYGEQEVDARADDFINKFKHQLKMQRSESVVRGGGGAQM